MDVFRQVAVLGNEETNGLVAVWGAKKHIHGYSV
jgi:hypothetical protein